ncbi:phage regulatory protein/antirepressor Ant [Acinetobacter sp. B10A]|uniref:phage antirepressor KilAC domain-containing protein n=1 Tax=Acinetobacter baretiae TaxID=2605383 RepID=UPI001B3C68C0|nr:phage antirepressor KilAC domain-containing protein [Acinetobacter baretiae]MBF7685997.1 phage regulatory protein/antirepressor Ant [Acinetobacter baretiae]
MNILTEFDSNVKTMSSREIAQLCSKQHGHVCRDIEPLNTTYLKMGLSKIGEGYYTHPNTGAQQHREFFLTKDQTVDLVTGYSLELRIKINRRWAELEAQQNKPQQPNELSRLEILQIALEAEQQNIALQQQVQRLEPKAQALDDLADSTNTYTIREAAKTLGVQEKRLVELLLAKRWVYRENSKHRRLCAYAEAVAKKVMMSRVTQLVNTTEGDKAYVQARITAFGLTRLTAIVKKAGIAA